MLPVRRVTVVVNPSSGLSREGTAEDAIRAALNEAGVAEVGVVTLSRNIDVKQVIADHVRRGTDVVIAAGGDGTVSAVASALAETETPLGVLPSGTLNHFAKDLGIPTELDQAARVIAAGQSTVVDVAKVNGRIFINNSSIGIYPAMVGFRDSLMRKGLPKRIAMPVGFLAAIWEFPNTSVRLVTGETGLVTRTPFVFVGNNAYQFAGLEAGSRKGLQDRVLQICTVRHTSRSALLRSAALALAGKEDIAPELHMENAERARIVTLRKHIPVALDGEIVLMNSPLEYSICPEALRVLAPQN